MPRTKQTARKSTSGFNPSASAASLVVARKVTGPSRSHPNDNDAATSSSSSDDEDNSSNKKQYSSYATIIKKNENFEKYYKQLDSFLQDDKEFEIFIETLKRPLPLTFRITSYKSFTTHILKMLKETHFKNLDELTKGEDCGKVLEASAKKQASLLNQLGGQQQQDETIYKILPWYPNQLAFQVNLSKQDVKKNIHFDEFKQFLMHQTENGNISRQEAVSMIPPLLLDVKPNHKVLDMCASPGSKTAQLIEYLHSDKSNPTPQGFVIANDLDNKRCYMLMHQLKRLASPNFMIINHDASVLPNFRRKKESASSSSSSSSSNDNDDSYENILFDRILADVPCSGDGTFRKNIDVWTKWNPSHACNLHGIQSRIARRAVELLEHDGIMVYSTCSLNPVENEAVVYNLLLKFKGQIELVESKHMLPGLKTVNGLLKWNIMGKTGDIYERADQVPAQFVNLMRPYMFSPELSVAKELNLDRCIRVMPHHQDTGGFFIAVIRKLKPNIPILVSNDTEMKQAPEADPDSAMKAPPAKRVKHIFEENPFKFIDSNNQLLNDWSKLKEFFQISDDFPYSQMMTRNRKGENVKNVYFVSKEIKELAMYNGDRFKFINMGVPLFSKAEIKDPSQIEMRICQESLDIIQKYFKKRIVYIKKLSDLIKILSESMPSLNELSDDLQKQISEQSRDQNGSLILTTRDINDDDSHNHNEIDKLVNTNANENVDADAAISFTAWLGKTTLRPLININGRNFFLNICGVDKSTIEKCCEKIRLEDKLNSEKSLKSNPQFKAKLELEKEKEKEKVAENIVDADMPSESKE